MPRDHVSPEDTTAGEHANAALKHTQEAANLLGAKLTGVVAGWAKSLVEKLEEVDFDTLGDPAPEEAELNELAAERLDRIRVIREAAKYVTPFSAYDIGRVIDTDGDTLTIWDAPTLNSSCLHIGCEEGVAKGGSATVELTLEEVNHLYALFGAWLNAIRISEQRQG
jgi:hypothetical protein